MLCWALMSQPSSLTIGRAVGPVVAVAVGDEEQVGRGADPDAAEAQLDAGEVGPLVAEDRAAVEPAVAVGVLEDQDAVLALRAAQPDRVRVVLDDPEPPRRVDGEGDRLDDVGLGGEQGGLEAFGQGHLARGHIRRQGAFFGSSAEASVGIMQAARATVTRERNRCDVMRFDSLRWFHARSFATFRGGRAEGGLDDTKKSGRRRAGEGSREMCEGDEDSSSCLVSRADTDSRRRIRGGCRDGGDRWMRNTGCARPGRCGRRRSWHSCWRGSSDVAGRARRPTRWCREAGRATRGGPYANEARRTGRSRRSRITPR